jgi:hypothetical protein
LAWGQGFGRRSRPNRRRTEAQPSCSPCLCAPVERAAAGLPVCLWRGAAARIWSPRRGASGTTGRPVLAWGQGFGRRSRPNRRRTEAQPARSPCLCAPAVERAAAGLLVCLWRVAAAFGALAAEAPPARLAGLSRLGGRVLGGGAGQTGAGPKPEPLALPVRARRARRSRTASASLAAAFMGPSQRRLRHDWPACLGLGAGLWAAEQAKQAPDRSPSRSPYLCAPVERAAAGLANISY